MIRWICMAGVLLLPGLLQAEEYKVGSLLPALEIEDQHRTKHKLGPSVRAIVFTRDMDGGAVIKEALAEGGKEKLADAGAVYIADVSAMPAIIRRIFAEPKMRNRPYAMLLDRDGSLTRNFPSQPGRVVLLKLDALRIQSVDYLDSSDGVNQALTGLKASK